MRDTVEHGCRSMAAVDCSLNLPRRIHVRPSTDADNVAVPTASHYSPVFSVRFR